MKIITSRSLTSWSEVIPQDWVQVSRTLCEQGLTVTPDLQPPSQIDNFGGFTEHVLALTFSRNLGQIRRIDGREYAGSNDPGDFLIIPTQAPSFHYWKCGYADEVMFYIDPKRLQQLATENDCLHVDRLELLPILSSRDPQLEAIATSFRAEMFNNELGGKLYTESLANLFLIHLLRKYCTQTFTLRSYDDGLSRYQLQQALDFIHAHLNSEFRLQDLAELLGMSQYYFCRLFKQSMGISPYQYVLKQRVELVKSLLSTQPRKSIADISLECGFSSQSQMTQHFRKITGTTPRAYRRN
jgi:AraC family transcriptional regulator